MAGENSRAKGLALRGRKSNRLRVTKMRLIIVAVAVLLMTGSAFAQVGQLPGNQVGQHVQHANDQADSKNGAPKKNDDKAYNAALRNLPNKEYDPWHGVR
jgi:hypothetical protein